MNYGREFGLLRGALAQDKVALSPLFLTVNGQASFATPISPGAHVSFSKSCHKIVLSYVFLCCIRGGVESPYVCLCRRRLGIKISQGTHRNK